MDSVRPIDEKVEVKKRNNNCQMKHVMNAFSHDIPMLSCSKLVIYAVKTYVELSLSSGPCCAVMYGFLGIK